MTQLIIGLARTENEAILMLNQVKEEGIKDKYLGAVAKEQLNLEPGERKDGAAQTFEGCRNRWCLWRSERHIGWSGEANGSDDVDWKCSA